MEISDSSKSKHWRREINHELSNHFCAAGQRAKHCLIYTQQYAGTFGKGQQAHSPSGDLQQVFPSAQATESLQGTAPTERLAGLLLSMHIDKLF